MKPVLVGIRASVALACAWLAPHASATNGTLAVRHLESKPTLRFVSADEWKYLSSHIDCPDLDASSHGPAKHPTIKVTGNEVRVSDGGTAHVVKLRPPEDLRSRSGWWSVGKVVCGSRGYGVLYADTYSRSRLLVFARYGPDWTEIGSHVIALPETGPAENPRATRFHVVERYAERDDHFTLAVLEVVGNRDRSINRAELVALARHEFLVERGGPELAGYADRPGPWITPEYVRELPVHLMPGVNVPRDVERHDVQVVANWSGRLRVRVDVADHPVFLHLRAFHPVQWEISVSQRTRLAAVHAVGSPRHEIIGNAKGFVVLRYRSEGGTKEEDDGLTRLTAYAGEARTLQKIPEHRLADVVVVDGKAGAMPQSRPNIHNPYLDPKLPEATAVRIANCAVFAEQDERIECYRLRATLLQGGGL